MYLCLGFHGESGLLRLFDYSLNGVSPSLATSSTAILDEFDITNALWDDIANWRQQNDELQKNATSRTIHTAAVGGIQTQRELHYQKVSQ